MTPLPPGQRERSDFPRFGLGIFARRFPANPARRALSVGGDVAAPLDAVEPFATLARVEQQSDFHCVTTWSVRDVRWSGVRFADFHREIVVPHVRPDPDATLVVVRGEDGFVASMMLEDLLADDVLLVDQLDGVALGIDHGAPFRLVAPAHYGFKNVKHIRSIEYWRDARHYRFPRPYPPFMDHPRGRVAEEERGRFLPVGLLRAVYRLLIPSTVRNFRNSLRRHLEG